MAYIPDTATWYIAEIIAEISVETDRHTIIHRNTVLINAISPEEAYSKAIQLGRDAETSYDNPEGKRVSVRFRGLRDLIVVHDPLEHGAELFFEEFIDPSEQQVQSWLRSKEQLSVFRPIEPTNGPDYSSREVLEDAAAVAKQIK